ncbi:MAG TPA: glycoside hydrolase family 6 protein [Longimicrobiaceae bacterium]|nr:glycoside hydrolase family 6 protein [Longimicrobiaceae bacterium]
MSARRPVRAARGGRRPWLHAGATASLTAFLVLGAPQGAGQSNPFAGKRLWVNPESPARTQANQWARSRPGDAALMRLIADQPQAIWMGEWMRDIRREVDSRVTRIAAAGALPVFVVYTIPHRDCGLYSAGGARNGNDYRRWILNFARGLRNRPAAVILEPDGLASADCMPARLQDERYVLMREAVEVLTGAGASVYIDAGNANWKPANVMAGLLRRAGIEGAQGFALNVSNFHSAQVNVAYGERLSRLVGGKHFVIDTSRNGRGAAVERGWCNTPNQALGRAPTTRTGHPLVDAYLWIKTPGESDGTCNGGPRAGGWWAEYALELSRAAEALGSLAPR